MNPIKIGLGSISSGISNVSSNTNGPISTIKSGRVFGIITTRNSPTPFQFNKYGGFTALGTIFYKDFDESKNEVGSLTDDFLNGCTTAKPFFPQFSYFPLLGELVYIIELPSPIPGQPQKYYINPINIWGNSQVNAQTPLKSTPVGKTFVENSSLRPLLNFEGDNIILGRKGNSIRFGSTVKTFSFLNNWSSTGNNGDPITIITNGIALDPSKDFYVEDINKDAASIYLTTTQRIPLNTNILAYNPNTAPIPINEYSNSSQIILNAGRIVLNSSQENLMFFSNGDVEISTNNMISLNGDGGIYLNSKRTKNTLGDVIPKIFLGTKSDGSKPTEPLLLGDKTVTLLGDMIAYLAIFAAQMTACSVTQEGAPLSKVEASSEALYSNLYSLFNRLEDITSQQNFTV
jgi:hypothetical protein